MGTEKRLVAAQVVAGGGGDFLASVRVHCPETDCVRTGAFCATCPRRISWTAGTPTSALGLVCELTVQTCASCRAAVPGAPLLAAVTYCESCLERSREAIDDAEVSGQD